MDGALGVWGFLHIAISGPNAGQGLVGEDAEEAPTSRGRASALLSGEGLRDVFATWLRARFEQLREDTRYKIGSPLKN